ncbi:hypothetical protein A2U01_0069820, partial [Trifolium medium]|nr:hypothetical protein [Trifolium medium]
KLGTRLDEVIWMLRGSSQCGMVEKTTLSIGD